MGTLIAYFKESQQAGKGKIYEEREIKFKLAEDNSVTGEGRLITPHACFQMVKEKFDDILANKGDIEKEYTGYRVGKEAILQILAQTDCEGLMIMQCRSDEGKDSLVFAGIDKGEQLLKDHTFPQDDSLLPKSNNGGVADIPMVVERIGLVSSSEVMARMGGGEAFTNKSEEEKAVLLTKAFLGIK